MSRTRGVRAASRSNSGSKIKLNAEAGCAPELQDGIGIGASRRTAPANGGEFHSVDAPADRVELRTDLPRHDGLDVQWHVEVLLLVGLFSSHAYETRTPARITDVAH